MNQRRIYAICPDSSPPIDPDTAGLVDLVGTKVEPLVLRPLEEVRLAVRMNQRRIYIHMSCLLIDLKGL